MCPRLLHLKDRHLLKRVVEVAEVAKAKVPVTFDKEYSKDKTCFTCSKKGHPSSSCTKVAVTNDDYSASIGLVHSIKKLAKETKNLKKAFTQLQKTSE
jgi:hypothetical protein